MEERQGVPAPSTLSRIGRLRLRSVRDRTGQHFIEGFRSFVQASDAGIALESVVYCEILAHNPLVQKKVRLARRAGTPVLRVTPEQFRALSSTPRASGIGAIARQHWIPLDSADPRRGLCWIAMSRIRSPGNLGTLLRTAEATGAGGVILIGDEIDPFDPAVVRASMGGIFHLPLVRASLDAFAAWARTHGCRVVGASPRGEVAYTNVPIDPPVVVLLGEERQGLSAEEMALCAHRIRIPIVGRADSLNVGVAAGIVLYEVLRRRSVQDAPAGDRMLASPEARMIPSGP